MRNGNPLTGLRIDENEEGRIFHGGEGINQINNQRIHINLQRPIINRENNNINGEDANEQDEQMNQNRINNNNEMDII